MKTKLILSLTAIAFLALGNSLCVGADTLDTANQKLVAGSNKPQPSGPPKSIFAHALIGDDNSIQLSAWERNLKVPSSAPFNSLKYTLLAFTEPTAIRTITIPNSSGTIALNPAAGSWEFEGTTADSFETTIAVVDPTADGSFYLGDQGVGDADLNVSAVVSTINSGLNVPGLATAVWTGPNLMKFEGATADGFEVSIDVADATADTVWRIPVAAAGTYSIMSSTLATNALDVANSVYGVSNGLTMEGATANDFETTIAPTDATADRTVTLPDASGAVMLSAGVPDAADGLFQAGQDFKYEGTTADAFESMIRFVADPTADAIAIMPQASGTVHLSQASTTVALVGDDQAVTPGNTTVLQITSDDATATNRTFTLSATGAVSGQIYVLIGPASNQCEIADTGIQKLSAAWSPGATDTLTLLFDGTNFLELTRADN